MAKLYVIRHAQVHIDPNLEPIEWSLSEAGMRQTRQLAQHENWDGVRCIYHSPERKAEETADIISGVTGIETKPADGLRELSMETGFLVNAEFDQRVGRYLQGGVDSAFETYETAHNRIVSCIKDLVRQSDGESLAVVSHGRILTVLYSYILKRRLGLEEWKSIKMPDLSVIDLAAYTVERGFLKYTAGS